MVFGNKELDQFFMKFFRASLIIILLVILLLLDVLGLVYPSEPAMIIVYGESELEHPPGKQKPPPSALLIPYDFSEGTRKVALIEALHFLSAMIYGYTFEYKPGSKVMKTEEVFNIELRDSIKRSRVDVLGEGAWKGIYRVKIAYPIDPYTEKWLRAFNSNKLRLEEAEGTSDFFSGWWGRSVAYMDALKNLVLISARKRYSSRPLTIKGDIILKENPEFNVGAGRWYCKIQGYVNFVDVVTY